MKNFVSRNPFSMHRFYGFLLENALIEWTHNDTDCFSVQLSLHDETINHSLSVLRLHVNNRFGPVTDRDQ